MGKITEKRAKNGQIYQNARLNGHVCFKTGDFGTLLMSLLLLSTVTLQMFSRQLFHKRLRQTLISDPPVCQPTSVRCNLCMCHKSSAVGGLARAGRTHH